MDKLITIIILALSILAIGNAAITYKKSTYFDTTNRVDLQEIVSNVEELEKSRLVELTRRLAAISDSDYQVLNILSDQFMQAIVFLGICLLLALSFILFLMLKPYSKH
jgi:hypothetical protein